MNRHQVFAALWFAERGHFEGENAREQACFRNGLHHAFNANTNEWPCSSCITINDCLLTRDNAFSYRVDLLQGYDTVMLNSLIIDSTAFTQEHV